MKGIRFLPFVYLYPNGKRRENGKARNYRKGVILPIGMVGIFCVASTVLCIDFIEQTIRYAQEEASLLTIASKTLAATGWGLMSIYLATKLWKNYKPTQKNRK